MAIIEPIIPIAAQQPNQAEERKTNPIEKVIFQVLNYVEEGFKDTCKGLKVAKATSGLAEEFTEIPSLIVDFFKWTKPFKIIKGGLACKKIYGNAEKLITSEEPWDKAMAGWALFKTIKKIIGAVETIGKYLKDFSLISKDALSWTEITGYIFLPVTYVNVGLSVNDSVKITKLMADFRANTKVKKSDVIDGERLEAMRKAVTYIKNEHKVIQKAKVISKECKIKDRAQRILERMVCETQREKEEAFKEGALVIRKLKDRLAARVVSSDIATTLSTLGAASTTIGLVCPATTLPIAVIDLICAAGATANYAYSRFIPDGDIFEDEKPMLYAHVFKEVNKAAKQLSKALDVVGFQIQELFSKSRQLVCV